METIDAKFSMCSYEPKYTDPQFHWKQKYYCRINRKRLLEAALCIIKALRFSAKQILAVLLSVVPKIGPSCTGNYFSALVIRRLSYPKYSHVRPTCSIIFPNGWWFAGWGIKSKRSETKEPLQSNVLGCQLAPILKAFETKNATCNRGNFKLSIPGIRGIIFTTGWGFGY